MKVLVLQTLNIESEALAVAAERKKWFLGYSVRDLIRQHAQKREAQTEKAPTVLTVAQAVQWLESIQQKGVRDNGAIERFARLIDPAADIPAPEPLPFVLPPAPTMPQAKRVQWEEDLQAAHLQRQAAAEAAWRTLTDTLRLRREWAAALEGHS